jgi:hypothetical protein
MEKLIDLYTYLVIGLEALVKMQKCYFQLSFIMSYVGNLENFFILILLNKCFGNSYV